MSVTIIFRTTGVWGAGIGVPLTKVQVDTNFYNLKVAVEDLQDNPPEAVSISEFEIVGNNLYIHMTDYSVQGPFVLPSVSYVPRGVWQPETVYFENDLVSFGGVLYVVIWNHTSDLVFDPGENDGAGHDYYAVFFEAPETSIPVGGTTRSVLGKLSTDDFHIGWILGLLPNGGLTGEILAKVSSADQNVVWTSPAALFGTEMAILDISGNYVLVAADAGKYLRFTKTGALTITIPTHASQAIATGKEFTCRIVNATSTFFSISGVTVNTPDGFSLSAFGPGSTITLKKVGTNVWDVFGLLAPIPA